MDNTANPPPARKHTGLLRLGLLAALWVSLLVPVQAEVRFDVFIGHDGIVPEASWFPVAVEVFNDGPPFDALFELSSAQFAQNQSRTMAVELPTGTLKRFIIPVFSSSRFSHTWDARLLDSRGKVRAEVQGKQVRKNNPWQIPLMGALTRTASGLPAFPEIKSNQRDLQPGVARLQANLFPDSPIALEGLNAIYLNSEKALELKDNQAKSLLAWLYSGGHLVVGVEQIIHVNGNEWLRKVLPCELTGLTTLSVHPGLQEWLRDSRRAETLEAPAQPARVIPPQRKNSIPANSAGTNPYENLSHDSKFEAEPMQVAVGSLRDGQTLIGADANPLAITASRGRGRITVLMFSPEMEPFLSWMNRPHFWAKLVGVPNDLLTAQNYNRPGGQSIDSVFGAMIDSKQARKLPVGWLLLLLVGYLVVIGPLDQYWLKKINRQMLTWLTFPAYVAFFSGLIYLIGYKLRAGEIEWNELHVVDVMPLGEQADWHGRTFASIYSPANSRYELASDLPFATLRGEFMGNYGGGGQEASRANVEQKGNSFRASVSVPVWTSQLYVNDWWQQAPLPLGVSVREQADRWEIRVENRLETRLTHVKLVADGKILNLGDIAATQTKTFTEPRIAGESVASYVSQHASGFENTVNQRQRAFGSDERGQIQNIPESSIAASFISAMQQPERYRAFITPPGFDLSPVVERGQAVVLAWADDYSPIKPINRFSPRRHHRDTLLRVAVPIGNKD